MPCTIRGGSYAANNTASCRDHTDITRDQGGKSVNDITIRCCSDLR